MALRKDKQKRHDRLCTLIQELVKTEGQVLHGYTWALRSRNAWADLVEVSPPTLTDLTNHPPIQKLVTMGYDDETGRAVKVTALRVGEAPKFSTRDMANIMGKAFTKQTGKKVSKQEWGMLNGMAENFPEGYQIDIFKHAITPDGWHGFMAICSVEVRQMIDEAKEQGQTSSAFKRYYRYPSIRVLRRFWEFAADAYKTAMFQKKGCADPDYPYFIDP